MPAFQLSQLVLPYMASYLQVQLVFFAFLVKPILEATVDHHDRASKQHQLNERLSLIDLKIILAVDFIKNSILPILLGI